MAIRKGDSLTVEVSGEPVRVEVISVYSDGLMFGAADDRSEEHTSELQSH